ncbi:MAG TPA: M1 family metallopeptidase [Candidatus Sulfotelmatobacter sp.]
MQTPHDLRAAATRRRFHLAKLSGWMRFLGLLVFLSHVLLVAAQNATASFGDPAVWQHPPVRKFHVIHYKLEINLDIDNGVISGFDLITFKPLAPRLRSLSLDSAELNIDSVSLIGKEGSARPLTHSTEAEKLRIRLDRDYNSAQTLVLRIAYHGAPRTGLFFVHPSAQSPDLPHEAFTQGEPSFNHFWFPCWDYPNDMATSETIVTVPEGEVVVSNGRLISVQHEGSKSVYDWKESVPHSSYLISLAVGPWKMLHDSYHNIPVDYYVNRQVDDATARRSFHLTPDMIGLFSRATGIEYPYEQYAQVAVTNYPFGGQENVSATTLTDTTLHDARADFDFPSTNLVSHELGQHWFGDYVQGRDWANIWLNEGFATYMEALYTQYREGEDAYRLAMREDQLAAQIEEHEYVRPIVDPHYDDAFDMFDATTHEKGAAVLDMLRYVLDGSQASLQTASQKEEFFHALHAYLATYKTRSVATSDLIAALNRATGKDLNWFFKEWVYQAGHPDYRVTANWDSDRKSEIITITQTQKTQGVPAVFTMPVELMAFGAHGEQIDKTLWNNQRNQQFTIPLTFEPVWIDFDPYGFLDKTLQFDQPFAAMQAAAQHDPSVLARLWAVNRMAAMTVPPEEDRVRALRAILDSDACYAVRAEAATSLGKLGVAQARDALLEAFKQPDSRVRSAAVEALGAWGKDTGVYTARVNALEHDDSYAVQAAAARAIGGIASARSFQVLADRLAENPDVHVRSAILAALPGTGDDRVLDVLLENAKPGNLVRLRQAALRALATVSVNAGDEQSAHLHQTLTDALSDGYFPLQLVADDVIAHFSRVEFKPQLAKLAASAPLAMQRKAAAKALAQLTKAQ